MFPFSFQIMKLLPIPLPTLGAPPPLGMWGSDLMWRYSAPPSPLAELKTQLPPQLAADPRLWNREDVSLFLQFCEREFDLPKFDLDLFQMNGKALCLLTKNDLAERIPGAGDVLHNVLQMLIRELQMLHKHLPSSPVTPTSRYPFSPLSQPPTPNWSALPPPDSPFHPAHIQHLMQSNSVTLSPAPSVDSQGRSPPQHQEQNQIGFAQNSSSSNQSDSDEDSYSEKPHSQQHQQHQQQQPEQQASPPLTPLSKEAPLTLSQQISNVVNSWSVQNENNGSNSAPSTPGAFVPVKREFFPDTPEPNTSKKRNIFFYLQNVKQNLLIFFLPFARFHRWQTFMGFLTAITELSIATIFQFYRMEKSRNGSFQNCRSGRISQIMGHSEKSFVNELRQNVQSVALLLSRKYFTQSSR